MATAPDTNEPLGEEELDPNALPVEELEDGEDDNSADDPLAPTAMKMGWVPRDQFKGDVSKWKPAEQFILDGHDIQSRTSKELREIKSTVDVMSRTTAQIMQEKLDEQRQSLMEAHQVAVEDGDGERAYILARRIDTLGQQTVPTGATDPVAAWKAENPWYGTDPLASDVAFQTCERLKVQGFGVEQQLAAARKAVEREFPELIPEAQQARTTRPTPPAVRGPTTRTTAPSNRQKGFHDMPKAAQDTARRLVDNGHLPNVDDYTAKYWQNAERKA